MKTKRYLVYVLLLTLAGISSGCLRGSGAEVLLVEDKSGESVELTRKDLAEFSRVTIDAADMSGAVRYEGYLLIDILRSAGAPSGDDLRGKNMSDYLIVEGADGYRVSFTLAELDPDFSNQTVILADKRDGQPLSAEEGTLRLVVPAETKRQARWVRQVVKLTIKGE